MMVSFNGFGAEYLTLEAEGDLAVGAPVMLCGNGRVKACTASGMPVGVAKVVRQGLVSVQVRGYCTVPYSGTVTVGIQRCTGNGSGGICENEAGRTLTVLDVNTAEKTCGILL